MKTDRRGWGFAVRGLCRLRWATLVIGVCTIGLSFVAERPAQAQKSKTDSPLSKLFKHQPPVVTGRVGWWDRQAGLQIEDCQVSIVKKGRMVTKTPTRIQIRIAGRIITDRDGGLPYIKEIFVSERLADEKSPNKHVDVLVVPVVDVQSKSGKKGDIVAFDVTVDYELYGYQWDGNNYFFRCGGKEIKLWDAIPRGK
jgi:hypothetical protein